MTCQKAAKIYNVPEATLRRKLNNDDLVSFAFHNITQEDPTTHVKTSKPSETSDGLEQETTERYQGQEQVVPLFRRIKGTVFLILSLCLKVNQKNEKKRSEHDCYGPTNTPEEIVLVAKQEINAEKAFDKAKSEVQELKSSKSPYQCLATASTSNDCEVKCGKVFKHSNGKWIQCSKCNGRWHEDGSTYECGHFVCYCC